MVVCAIGFGFSVYLYYTLLYCCVCFTPQLIRSQHTARGWGSSTDHDLPCTYHHLLTQNLDLAPRQNTEYKSYSKCVWVCALSQTYSAGLHRSKQTATSPDDGYWGAPRRGQMELTHPRAD
ncbi:hypothetical protein BO94DRAFT_178235 [Aspergillus sclerotioniger CBS 115572]|uniref:Uncharacterized protein n=1 Tax=Aspergillus sclerotioniger CBS 115572 TaxID=1450535 RepID=A0A317VZS8_9EURO|nr:hypothetical protein BO94DRAFT_178235 [Aspergillus sclerotioniger CBS 115572]PWY78467.1 hypothetical protein BO94DRAFT_178235 [Aspergillus sclerotioniger CBS 115572]